MNERGVAVAMAAVPAARSPRGDAVGSLGVMRLVLDRAASVDEAVAIFRRTAVDFTGGPPLHYMVADATGASAVIEYVARRACTCCAAQRVMTNFVLTGDAPADDRYRTATAGLAAHDAGVGARGCCSRVKQPHTRWSVAYDLRARKVHVVMGQRYGRVLTFNL